jgi:drug/metabolite transporter (DMT)-like permease
MRRNYILFSSLLFVTIIWGATFALIKEALKSVGPFYFLAIRFTIAGIIMFFIFRRSFKGHPIPFSYLLGGIFLFLGYALQTVGLKYTTASNAAFITGLSVVIVPFLEIIFMKRRLPFFSALGAIFSTVGLWLLTGIQTIAINYGDLLTILCALCFASQIITIGIIAPDGDSGVIATTQVIIVAVLSWFSIFLFKENIHIKFSSTAIWAILITAIFATAIAFYVQALAQKEINPTTVALIFATEPVFGGVFGYLLLGEVLRLSGIIGAALILLGMVLTQIPGRGMQ